MGQALSVTYTSTGMKTWKYKLNLTNGTVLYNQSKIQIGCDDGAIIDLPVPINPLCKSCKTATTTTGSGAKQLYGENIIATTAYLGGYGKVKITIDFTGNPNQGIKKPLIVAEDFDLGVILNPENAYGSNTYSGTFKKNIEKSGSTLRNLIYEDYKQYDIIYVDWDNGVDYMQRNAYALEEVINWVNAQKGLSGSTTKNVVLGQSMGGVIARYALADMAQRGIDHQTSLFISHDAPQQGANIPISLQYMFRHLTKQYIQTAYAPAGIITMSILENNVGISNYLSILDAPASRQLLKNSINYDYPMNTAISTDFYDELKSKGLPNSGGYPTLCRNIALSNGSECGDTQNFQPGNDLVNFTYNKGLSFWGDLFSMVYLPLGGAIGGTLLNPKLYGVGFLGLIPGHSKFSVNFISRALYDYAGNEIFKGKISYTKKIAWLFNTTINLTNVSKNQPSGILPLDTYGGGYYDTKIITGTVTVNGLYIRDRFSFIPTASALDIGKRNVTLDDSDYKKSYVGAIPLQAPKNSPFSNYITDFDKYNPNSRNKNHISFNTRNGDWLASELNSINNPTILPLSANCSYMCTGNSVSQITGNDGLCGTSIFSVPSGATSYNWSITEGANLVNLTGNSTNSVTITPINTTTNGYITLNVNYGSSSCGYVTITKRVKIETPTNIIMGSAEYDDYCETVYNYMNLAALGAENNSNLHLYNFRSSIPNQDNLIRCEANGYTQFGDLRYTIRVPRTLIGGSVWYSYSYTNKCGELITSPYEETLSPYDCYSGKNLKTSSSDTIFTIYPNPSSSTINIALFDETKTPTKKALITGKLYNLNNIEKCYVTIRNNSAQIDVSNLNKGIYVLKIDVNGKTESHQVIVK